MSTVLSGTRTRPRSGLLLRGLSDEKLVARIRAGDERAFEVVYDRYQGPLLSFTRHMLGDHAEAEDVLQHTFVSAHRALLADDRPIQLKAWLFAIARNRSLTVLRSRRHDVDLDEAAPSVAGLSAEVEQRADLRELLGDLRRLPEEQRSALVLFELGAHSHEDIAMILGVRKEKVKALVFQARETLQAQRSARAIDCATIREEIATSHGGALRRAHLRRHLDVCPGCTAFRTEVTRQRAAMAALLPVVPGVTLKASVLGGLFGGGGAGGVGASLSGGGAAAAGAAGLGAAASGGGVFALVGLQGAAVKGLSVIAAAAGAGGGLAALDRTTETPRSPARVVAAGGPTSTVPAPPSVAPVTDLESLTPAASRLATGPAGAPRRVHAARARSASVRGTAVVPAATGGLPAAFGPLAPGSHGLPVLVPAVALPGSGRPAFADSPAKPLGPVQLASVGRRGSGEGRKKDAGAAKRDRRASDRAASASPGRRDRSPAPTSRRRGRPAPAPRGGPAPSRPAPGPRTSTAAPRRVVASPRPAVAVVARAASRPQRSGGARPKAVSPAGRAAPQRSAGKGRSSAPGGTSAGRRPAKGTPKRAAGPAPAAPANGPDTGRTKGPGHEADAPGRSGERGHAAGGR